MGALEVTKTGKLMGDGRRARVLEAPMRKGHSCLGSSLLVPSCDLCYSKKLQQKQPVSDILPKHRPICLSPVLQA